MRTTSIIVSAAIAGSVSSGCEQSSPSGAGTYLGTWPLSCASVRVPALGSCQLAPTTLFLRQEDGSVDGDTFHARIQGVASASAVTCEVGGPRSIPAGTVTGRLEGGKVFLDVDGWLELQGDVYRPTLSGSLVELRMNGTIHHADVPSHGTPCTAGPLETSGF